MDNNTQGRKWQLTINNPEDHGLTRDAIIERVNLISYTYTCMCDEISESRTPHTHIYIYSIGPIRFQRLKNLFPAAHIEKARGTHKENRDYILKVGKWKDDIKSETSLPDTFTELGTMPTEKSSVEKKEVLYNMIKSGMSNDEIIETDKSYIYHLKKMDEIRETLKEKEYSTKDRNVNVTYVTGDTGLGKTRDIYNEHLGNMSRITTYRKDGTVIFDNYHGEDVLVFEEFTGQVPLTDMLNYLDRYPLILPARYQDKVACFSKVYITSNLPLHDLYVREQLEQPKSWMAFLRRINTVKEYRPDGTITKYHLEGGYLLEDKNEE